MDRPASRLPSAEVDAEARRSPGGNVYEIDNTFGPFTGDSAISPHAIIGAWKVDAAGLVVGAFIPNEKNVAPADPRLPKGVTVLVPRSP